MVQGMAALEMLNIMETAPATAVSPLRRSENAQTHRSDEARLFRPETLRCRSAFFRRARQQPAFEGVRQKACGPYRPAPGGLRCYHRRPVKWANYLSTVVDREGNMVILYKGS